jgi:tRNA A-37 threonylcarbamoyl transferase component Bud32
MQKETTIFIISVGCVVTALLVYKYASKTKSAPEKELIPPSIKEIIKQSQNKQYLGIDSANCMKFIFDSYFLKIIMIDPRSGIISIGKDVTVGITDESFDAEVINHRNFNKACPTLAPILHAHEKYDKSEWDIFRRGLGLDDNEIDQAFENISKALDNGLKVGIIAMDKLDGYTNVIVNKDDMVVSGHDQMPSIIASIIYVMCRAKMIHLDLHSNNVMCKNGDIKFIDFNDVIWFENDISQACKSFDFDHLFELFKEKENKYPKKIIWILNWCKQNKDKLPEIRDKYFEINRTNIYNEHH